MSMSTGQMREGSGRTLRQRPPRATVRIDEQFRVPQQTRQRRRIAEFQSRWQNIKDDLPPQLSRRHSLVSSLLLIETCLK
jgi:hypothetical protein